MHYNMGLPVLSTFRRFLALLERGDYMGAAREMRQSRWHHQVGQRAKTLVRMMETGQWPRC